MFPEKIEFDGKIYRTKSYNKMLDIIYQETKQLQGHKKEEVSQKYGRLRSGAQSRARTGTSLKDIGF